MSGEAMMAALLAGEQKSLLDAESKARNKLANMLYRAKRKPEGNYDFETSNWIPTARENFGHYGSPFHVQSFSSWSHTWRLVNRALKGEDVPQNVRDFVDKHWPGLHQKAMIGAVDGLMKKSDKAERAELKRKKAAEASTYAKSSAGKIDARKRQLAGLQATLKKVNARVQALATRISKVKRSIGALERAQKARAT